MAAVYNGFDKAHQWASKHGWQDGGLLGAVPGRMAEGPPASLLLSQMEQELSALRAHTFRELEQKVCLLPGPSWQRFIAMRGSRHRHPYAAVWWH